MIEAALAAVNTAVDARLEFMRGDVMLRSACVSTPSSAPVRARLSVLATMTDGVVARLSVGYHGDAMTTTSERMLLGRVALHLENVLRLRDAKRTWAVGTNPEDRALWPLLREGKVSLRRRNSTSLVYDVIDTTGAEERRRLSESEEHILRLAARGAPFRAIADELTLSEASVSRRLANAAAKFGVRSNFEALQIAAHLLFDEIPHVELSRLTPAEREVFALLRTGLSNAAIAQLRSRSERTIANQVAAVLRKTHASTRRALVAGGRRVTRRPKVTASDRSRGP